MIFFPSKVSPSAAFPIYGGTFLARLCDSAHAFRAESASQLSPWLARSSNVQSMSQLHFALIKRRSNLLITEEKTFSIRAQSGRTECLLIENGINAKTYPTETYTRIIHLHFDSVRPGHRCALKGL